MTTQLTFAQVLKMLQKGQRRDDFASRSDSLMNTDFYRSMTSQRAELLSRVTTLRTQVGTFQSEAQEVRNTYWINHWQKELAAVSRAIHSLGEQQ